MAIVKFHNTAGQECKVFWPPETLSEAEQNYHDCNCDCQLCREEKTMSDRIGNEEVVRFSLGREVTGQDLVKHAAGRTLVALARQHMERKGGSFVNALHAVAPICPGEIKAYLNLEFPPVTSASSYGSKGGGSEASELWFRERAGWTAGGVRDWLKQQELAGGELARNEGGWSYTPQKRT